MSKFLSVWLNRRNQWAERIVGQDVYSLNDCKREDVYMKLFLALDSELSPENLTCDGELSGRELRNKQAFLEGAWKDLESIAGVGFELEDKRIYEYGKSVRECPGCGYDGHLSAVPNVYNCPNCGQFTSN